MKLLNQVNFLYDFMIKYSFQGAHFLVAGHQNEMSLLREDDLIIENTQHLLQTT